MFEIGQHVIHPGQGVCTVVGFTNDDPTPMIILHAKSGHAATQLMFPQSQEGRLHCAISREDAEEILDRYGELAVDTFTERNSSLEETYFKQQLKLGAPETVRIFKTMRHRIAHAEKIGKKPSSYYTRILKEARRRAVEELAVALDLATEDADERFIAAISADEPGLN